VSERGAAGEILCRTSETVHLAGDLEFESRKFQNREPRLRERKTVGAQTARACITEKMKMQDFNAGPHRSRHLPIDWGENC